MCVIHCRNGCTDMLYYCVIFVILNKKNNNMHARLCVVNVRRMGWKVGGRVGVNLIPARDISSPDAIPS